jgi:hypothetical protein
MAQLQSSDEAADWVHKNMPVKNELTAADADLVGAAFRDRLAVIEAETSALENRSHSPAAHAGTELSEPLPDFAGTPSPGVLEAQGEAHHIRFAQPRALSRKVSDEYTVPVCRLHHRELHSYGDEASWWAGVSIDPLPIALDLWRRTRAE